VAHVIVNALDTPVCENNSIKFIQGKAHKIYQWKFHCKKSQYLTAQRS
jgi:hypothetical protein